MRIEPSACADGFLNNVRYFFNIYLSEDLTKVKFCRQTADITYK